MEFAGGGDLLSKVETHRLKGTLIPEKQIWNIFVQTVRGLKALHDMKICHRDLKVPHPLCPLRLPTSTSHLMEWRSWEI
jgi:serine/threonine protein kinase